MIGVAFSAIALLLFSNPVLAATPADETISTKNYAGQSLVEAQFADTDLDDADFSNADLRGAVFDNTSMVNANLHAADLSYGITYLVDFTRADLSDAVLVEAMLLRSTFDQAKIAGADFTNALLDRQQLKKLCAVASGVNPKTGVETRASLQCR